MNLGGSETPRYPLPVPVSNDPASGQAARQWTPAFSTELITALAEFYGMNNPEFRRMVWQHVGERLETHDRLGRDEYPDYRDDITAIVDALKAQGNEKAALKALVDEMEVLRPNTRALDLLRDCYMAIMGLTALSVEQLHSIFTAIEPWRWNLVQVSQLAHEAAFEDEVPLPLRDEQDLRDVVRQLNEARVAAAARPPLVVRFLDKLGSSAPGPGGAKLAAVVERIAGELSLSLDDVRSQVPSTRTADRRILQVRMEETSPPGRQPRYAIKAAVFDVFAGSRQSIMSWQCQEDCPREDIDTVGRQFIECAQDLGRTVGDVSNVMVEFLLPWSLLSHPVERWSLDEDRYWIGHTFPLVVRSLDRQRKEAFYRAWRHRWDLLSGAENHRPAGDRIGWLHHGDSTVPERASSDGRVIPLTGEYDLTRWLAEDVNSGTPGLGLTFCYRPDDPFSLTGLKSAVHEGIPLLLWLRERSDVNQLERLLDRVQIHDLPGEVLKWRRLTAGEDASTRDARYHVVLLWDDPSGVVRPSENLFAAPR